MLGECMGQSGAHRPDEEIRPRHCAKQQHQPSALWVLDAQDSLQQCLVFSGSDFELTQHKLWRTKNSDATFFWNTVDAPLHTHFTEKFQCLEGPTSAVPHNRLAMVKSNLGVVPQFFPQDLVEDSMRHIDHPECAEAFHISKPL